MIENGTIARAKNLRHKSCRKRRKPPLAASQFIKAAGVRVYMVARTAGIHNVAMTAYRYNRKRNRKVRMEIWGAFRQLSGQNVTYDQFWARVIPTRSRQFLDKSKIKTPHPGSYVKSRIVGAGIKLGALATEARISPSTLTHYLCGETRKRDGQSKVAQAFRRLTGIRIKFSDFWGLLASRRSA